MQVKVRFLDNLRLEASFDDFTVVADQPIRYKGDGTAPGPFDYFLASSALCAAYFVKAYCITREIPTEDISITQDNIIDPDNRYKQTFKITAKLPDSISEKDKAGIIASIERCSVKRVIQNSPDFEIEAFNILGQSAGLQFETTLDKNNKTIILGKDATLEDTIDQMSGLLKTLGIKVEIASWRNIVPHIWSVHIRDADSPMCYTNGKGATRDAALASALGEYLERLSNNYFYNDYFLGEEISHSKFVHYANEKWFPIPANNSVPKGLMDKYLISLYNNDGQLGGSHLVDTTSGNSLRGICAIPFTRQSDDQQIFIPVNLIGNLFVSNGMSAGNTKYEARVQSLSEILERAVKNKIIVEELTLPDVPQDILAKFPKIIEGIEKIEAQGFPILVKDASLGGKFPVVCVTLMNPKTGGVFASFGSHPCFEIALERTLTELMQGRSFEGLDDVLAPTFNQAAVTEPNNIVEHFIDSAGVISWKFFSAKEDFSFSPWDFSGTTEDEYNYLMQIFKDMEKEVYIADYNDLGAYACRILVPGYSEIYPIEDLVWDNNNKGLQFRSDILNIHSLNEDKLAILLENLEDSEIDDYMPITDLIGVAFDDATPWGRCTIGELKALILLALKNLEDAKPFVEAFLQYNDNTPQRRKFYQVLDNVLDILIDPELSIEDFSKNLKRMYGSELTDNAIACAKGELNFFGLTPTNMNLEGIDKHQKLINSYKKLMSKRS